MKLTKEFIELQGFRFETYTDEGYLIFTIRNEDRIYDMILNTIDDTMTIDRYEGDDEPECVYDGQTLNVIQFSGLLKHFREITNGSISFPKNFVEDFMSADYDYNQNDFDGMCDVSLLMLLAKEEYEKCKPFIDFRKEHYRKMGWEYKDIPEESFRDYSKITEINKNPQ